MCKQKTKGGLQVNLKNHVQYINAEALYRSNGLSIKVKITDVKCTWGRMRYCITPVNGHGVTWVENGLQLPHELETRA